MTEPDTICAIATGQGGAIGIVRVSGPEAIRLTEKIFRAHKGKKLDEAKSSTLSYGWIVDAEEKPVDEVLVSVFRSPHSYTGENSTEISCHNSPYVMQKVMQLLLDNGCRLAQPGEYTQRAFMNGKMDLSQAESIADLIAAKTAAAHRLAVNQMRGTYSAELKKLRDKLIELQSLMELELDFSDHEELEFADRGQLKSLADTIEQKISRLAHSFQAGNAIKEGIPVAIIGETNVGKSTLLNALLGEDKAIVSQINGTTRDAIEDTMTINGMLFRFIDTAGIRKTDDEIEQLGIEKTFSKIEQANIILWLIDATDSHTQNINQQILTAVKNKQTLMVVNKTEEMTPDSLKLLSEKLHAAIPFPTIFISAKNKTNLEELENMLTTMAQIPKDMENDIIVSNMRHYEALTLALEDIRRIKAGLQTSLPTDFIAQDMRDCIYQLSDIIGEVTSTTILHNIFDRFCIGK